MSGRGPYETLLGADLIKKLAQCHPHRMRYTPGLESGVGKMTKFYEYPKKTIYIPYGRLVPVWRCVCACVHGPTSGQISIRTDRERRERETYGQHRQEQRASTNRRSMCAISPALRISVPCIPKLNPGCCCCCCCCCQEPALCCAY